MKILLKWNERTIVEITKEKNLLISSANTEEIIEARKTGLMAGLLSQISIVSPQLPKLILSRIPEHLQEDYIEFIKQTQCRCNTDKFSVEISE